MIHASLSDRSEVGRIVLNVDTDHAGHQELWWETLSGDPPPVPGRLDVAAIALVTKAMNFGQDLHLDGTVSWTLLASLEEFVEAWTSWRPDIYRPIQITASEVDDDRGVENVELATKTVVAASGGVDSTYALYAHAKGLIGRRSLDVTGAVLVQGFDIPLDQPDPWEAAHRSATEITDAVGVPLIGMRTNWQAVADPEWEMSFGTAVAAVLHLFCDRAGVATVAADNSYPHLSIPWGSNPITEPLLASTRMGIAYTGGGITRTQKCAAIGTEEAVRRHIRVCWEGPDKGRNCGKCEKCVRTKVNFAAAGIGEIDALGPLELEQLAGVQLRSVTARDLYQELAGECDALDPAVAREVRRLSESDIVNGQ